MRRVFSIGLMLALAITAGSPLRAQTTGQQPQPAPAEAKKKIDGTWAGSYEGDGSGKFEMIFAAADGKDTGKINVVPDDGENYSVDLKALTFDGTKLLATYALPDGGEIMLEGTLNEAGLTGKWAVGNAGNSSATGTWKASKK